VTLASSRTARNIVLATFATQAIVTMSNSTLPTIAPKLAEALGMDAALIGYQVSILFGGAVTGTLFGGIYTRRYGACRTMQMSLALSGMGILMMILPSVLAIVAGSLVAGFGQGILNSATAHLLVKYTQPSRRKLLFSIKQSGVPFAAMQRALATFLVVYLVAERAYSLIDAGVMLSVLHAGGLAGRLAWGWIADRYSSTAVLLAVAAISVACTFALIALSTAWPRTAVYALFFVFGSAALGWNGVLHAEIARLSPPGLTSVVAGGSTFFVFGGVLIGPAIFAAVYGLLGNYSATMILLAVAAAAGGVFLLLARAAAPAPRPAA